MTTFVRRPERVEAWRVGSDEPMPEWAAERWWWQTLGDLTLLVNHRSEWCIKGDWLIKEWQDSYCGGMPDAEFRALYEKEPPQ